MLTEPHHCVHKHKSKLKAQPGEVKRGALPYVCRCDESEAVSDASDGSEALKGDAGAIQALAGESLSPWSSAHNGMLFSSLAADLPVYWRTECLCRG